MRYGIFRGPIRPENQIHRQRTWARLETAQRYAEQHQREAAQYRAVCEQCGIDPGYLLEPITAAPVPKESAPC